MIDGFSRILPSVLIPLLVALLTPWLTKKFFQSQDYIVRKGGKPVIPKWAEDKSLLKKLDFFKNLEIILLLVLWVTMLIMVGPYFTSGDKMNQKMDMAELITQLPVMLPFLISFIVFIATSLGPAYVVASFILGIIFYLIFWKVDKKIYFNYSLRMYDPTYEYSAYRLKDPVHMDGMLEKWFFSPFFVSTIVLLILKILFLS